MWHAKRRQTRYETIQDRRGVRHDNKTLDVCDMPREDRRGMRQYKTGEVLDMTTRQCVCDMRRQTRYETIQDRRGVRHDNKTVDVCDIPREDRRGMRQYKTGEMLDMTTRHWMYLTCEEKTDEVWNNTRQARC